ncbi:uncharacterized protein LOC115091243 [Rhinatrema bivittatum]|uniref:uncharacterized protein LOC115091243 n=1 Tax=Rhinatrema bivittatum TaxID=194408 RepID=UPI001125D377|nr:uncharacterized protein LOC115091243 [Rhinatrema bivittatum]XP_029457216.1 uncharacterized protein LOC115091243 [Rhinatrema bivittatum]
MLGVPGADPMSEPKRNPILVSLYKAPCFFLVMEAIQELILNGMPRRQILKGVGPLEGLYSLDTVVRELLRFPKVDVLVCAVSKQMTIPMEGGAAFKDVHDRRIEAILKQAFEAVAKTLQIASCCSLVARSLLLFQEIDNSDMNSRAVMEPAAAFILSDAGCDLVRTSARGVASVIEAKLQLWLRNWAAKANLMKLLFKGSLLFVSELEKLSSKWGRSPVPPLPEDKKQSPRPFGMRDHLRGSRHFHPYRGLDLLANLSPFVPETPSEEQAQVVEPPEHSNKGLPTHRQEKEIGGSLSFIRVGSRLHWISMSWK